MLEEPAGTPLGTWGVKLNGGVVLPPDTSGRVVGGDMPGGVTEGGSTNWEMASLLGSDSGKP